MIRAQSWAKSTASLNLGGGGHKPETHYGSLSVRLHFTRCSRALTKDMLFNSKRLMCFNFNGSNLMTRCFSKDMILEVSIITTMSCEGCDWQANEPIKRLTCPTILHLTWNIALKTVFFELPSICSQWYIDGLHSSVYTVNVCLWLSPWQQSGCD